MRDHPACEVLLRQVDESGRKSLEHLHLVYSAPNGPDAATDSLQRGTLARLAKFLLRILNWVFFRRSRLQPSNLVLVVDNNKRAA
jgi:hypothetical protein